MDAKICGVKDPKTLEYIINHNYSLAKIDK